MGEGEEGSRTRRRMGGRGHVHYSNSHGSSSSSSSSNMEGSAHGIHLSQRRSDSVDSAGSAKESGKIAMIRKGSEANVLGHVATPIQVALFALAVLLTMHSFYVLKDQITGTKEVKLADESYWKQLLLVWSSGWITAASTGLGVLPFICFSEPSANAVAISNSIAAGMMLAASIGLIAEGCLEETTPDTTFLPALRVLLGLYLGVAFVRGSSIIFGESEPTDMLTAKINMRKVLIIMTVMTVHSFSEGVGIGVSYHSSSLGGFISATLAVHNIPEGLAISIVLVPRGFSILSSCLWCIFSSLPQPISAVLAYIFTEQFKFVLPIGLGFAGGAMLYVVFTELLPEAQESLSVLKTYTITFFSMLMMGILQVLLREHV